MANLIAITYPGPDTAEKAMEHVDWAAFDKQIDVLDACWMTANDGKVTVHPGGRHVAAKAALGGAVGLLVGALFAAPVVGLAAGAAYGAHRGKHHERPLDDPFVESIKQQVADGGSAIVILYEEGTNTELAGVDLAQFGGVAHGTAIPVEELARIQTLLDQQSSR